MTHCFSKQRQSNGSGPSDGPIIDLRQIVKTFATPSGPFTALRNINLQVRAGERIAVVGKSGSGKSTLINLIAGIDRPSAGEVSVAGAAVHALNQEQLARWRGQKVGVVFQFFQLLPTLTVAENVMLPMDFCDTWLARERRDRALANDPPIIVADEPTGNLDSHTSEAVLRLFSELAAEGKTILLVTHERDVTSYVTRTITLADGAIVAGAGASDGAGSRAVE